MPPDVTILAPNDEAFDKIPYSSLGPAYEANQSQIVRSILQYHILPGSHPAAGYSGSFSFDQTWLQNASYTNLTGGQVVGGVKQAGNVNIFTSGLGTRSTLVTPDLPSTGGIVHIIDNFLIPPQSFIQTAPQFNLTAAGGAVENAYVFTLDLVSARPCSLTEYVDSQQHLTIFVPQNAAFQALGGTLQSMASSQLQRILNYHIVHSSPVGYSTNLPNGTILRTRSGQNLTITFASNSLFVNQARVLQQDLLLSNGVMHVIDNFLDPDTLSMTANPEIPTAPPLLKGTSLSENLVPFTSFLPTGVTSFDTSSASPTDTFGVSDIRKGTSSKMSSRRASSTSSGQEKNGGGRLKLQRATAVAVNSGFLGTLCWTIGILEAW
ncbi:MAG: hypothetical protein Q9168_001155 [Polycauliona sp. 1 TL-2023]